MGSPLFFGQNVSAGSLPASDFNESFENGNFDNAGWLSTGGSTNVTSPAGGFAGGGTHSRQYNPIVTPMYDRWVKGADSTNGTFRFGLYITTLPTSFCSILAIKALNANTVLDIYMAGGTTATVRGATNASLTFPSATWLDVEIKQNKNAASVCRVNHGSDQAFTGNNDNFGELDLGAIIYSTDGDFKFDFVQWNNSATAYISP